MTDTEKFESAKRAISTGMDASKLCLPFLSVVPATGASVSILAGSRGQSTLCASDSTAAHLDEIQFDLGEGPCWEAMSTHRPVLAPHLRSVSYPAWPMFTQAFRTDERYGSVEAMYAFPLVVGSLEIGAVDLYSSTAVELTGTQVKNAMELAGLAAWQVLRRILAESSSDTDDTEHGSFGSRREVHQATGMVLAQLSISADDAALLLRAHAFSTDRSVRDVASDVVSGLIDFSKDPR